MEPDELNDDATLVPCDQCGAETSPEDLIDGLCPECYALSEDSPTQPE